MTEPPAATATGTAFYILTAGATIVYYRRRVFSSIWDALILGVLPVAAAGFLGWVLFKSLIAAPRAQIWSLIGIVAVGLILMLAARFIPRSPFFQTPWKATRRKPEPEAGLRCQSLRWRSPACTIRAPSAPAAPVTTPLVMVGPCSAPKSFPARMIGFAVALNPSMKAPWSVEAS